jgi:Na+-driven multidrug efflux pump
MAHFVNPKHTVSFSREGFKLNKRIIISIISIGLSPFLINATASLVNVFFNRSLLTYGGHLAIGAYGIINSFGMIVVMLIIGLCQGMQPIVGYNYGAMHLDRVEQAFKRTCLVATIITTLGFLASLLFPHVIVRAFTTDGELSDLAIHGIRLVLLGFPLVGFQVVTTNFFQSLGMASKAIFLSLSRQVLFLIPLIWLLPQFFDLEGVWLASPISDAIAAAVAFFFLLYQWRRIEAQIALQRAKK